MPALRRIALVFSLVLALATAASAKTVKIRGYVTAVTSPTSFEIEDYKITGGGLALSFEKEGHDAAPEGFKPEDIRVGTDLEITGELDEKTGELRAQSIKVFLDEGKRLKRTAVIDRLPQILKQPDGSFSGAFFADGQQIRLAPATQVVFRPSHAEREALKKSGQKSATGEDEDIGLRPLQSLEEIHPNMLLTYEGTRQADGSLAASRLEFTRNELEPGEVKMWKALTPFGKNPDFQKFKPGEMTINGVGKFKIIPNQYVQRYIQELGHSLVPLYQRAMPESDPSKIPFRFFLVENKEPNAFALANGTVVVNSGLFDILESEAQLASVLSHEIAHAIQRHAWRQQQYHKGARTAMKIAGILGSAATGDSAIASATQLIDTAIKKGYSRSLENQADRLGLQYMYEAGYDIREAPRVWQLMTQKYGDKSSSFWSDHDNNTTRRSYLMAEIRNNYADADYSKLQKGSFSLTPVTEKIHDPSGKKVKVKY
ncbi:MAG TPA: M48 family metalloprotease [Terriglobales bacterium]|nr:M48 family metalloprotease [Terriglobales bacterium]